MASGSSSGQIHVMTINMGGGGSADGRRAEVNGIIVSEKNPDIVLAQEIGAPNDNGHQWKLDAPLYTYHTNKNAKRTCPGIMWETSKFEEITPDIETNLKEFKTKTSSMYKKQDDTTADIRDRVCTVLLKHKKSGSKVWVLSWHGPHNFKKPTDENKFSIYKQLLVYVKLLTDRGEKKVLIGGDFNLDFKFIQKKERDASIFEWEEYKLLQEKPRIDNILCSKGNISIVRTEAIKNGTLLDHNPVLAVVTI